MVKHMLRTSILHSIRSHLLSGVGLRFSCMRTVYQKRKGRQRVDDRFTQCSLLGPSSTALSCISIATEVCSLLLSVKWFFSTLKVTESPVSVLYAPSMWSAVASSPSWNWKLQPCGAYYPRLPCLRCLYKCSRKFRSTIYSKLAVELGDILSNITSWMLFLPNKWLCPFCNWHEATGPCREAVRAMSDGLLNSLWRPICGDQYDQAVTNAESEEHLKSQGALLSFDLIVCISWHKTHINNNYRTLFRCLLALFSDICSLGGLLKGSTSIFCITCFLRSY